MMFIHLHGLRFQGFHGLYEEERLLGNEYEVNLSVGFEPKQLPINGLEQTIDYTQLLKLVKNRMAVPTPLLETLATGIAIEICSGYSEVVKISISIKKLYPPLNNFEGAVGVSFEWNK
jgi:dihydroneopterin aldolase